MVGVPRILPHRAYNPSSWLLQKAWVVRQQTTEMPVKMWVVDKTQLGNPFLLMHMRYTVLPCWERELEVPAGNLCKKSFWGKNTCSKNSEKTGVAVIGCQM